MSIKPDFFIVGAAKSGTTALQQMLDQHPAIYMSPIKEPNFFYTDVEISELRKGLQEKLKKENAEQWIKDGMHGERWNAFLRDESLYRQLFSDAQANQFCGEASVSYLYSSHAAQLIYQYNPQAKIIILLRNPVERSWSHYKMEKRMGILKEDFQSAFEKWKDSSHPIWGKDPIFLSGGLYYNQVKRFMDVFPREQLFICLYDDYKINADKTLHQILNFIGVNDATPHEFVKNKVANEARKSIIDNFLPSGKLKTILRKFVQRIGIHRFLKQVLTSENNEPLSKDHKMALHKYYSSDIEKLELLLNINLSNWKKIEN